MIHGDHPRTMHHFIHGCVTTGRVTPGPESVQTKNQSARRGRAISDVQTRTAVGLKSRLVSHPLRNGGFGITRGGAGQIGKLLTLPSIIRCQHIVLNIHTVYPAVGGDLNHQTVRTSRKC